jgi:hypothetical protein
MSKTIKLAWIAGQNHWILFYKNNEIIGEILATKEILKNILYASFSDFKFKEFLNSMNRASPYAQTNDYGETVCVFFEDKKRKIVNKMLFIEGCEHFAIACYDKSYLAGKEDAQAYLGEYNDNQGATINQAKSAIGDWTKLLINLIGRDEAEQILGPELIHSVAYNNGANEATIKYLEDRCEDIITFLENNENTETSKNIVNNTKFLIQNFIIDH